MIKAKETVCIPCNYILTEKHIQKRFNVVCVCKSSMDERKVLLRLCTSQGQQSNIVEYLE